MKLARITVTPLGLRSVNVPNRAYLDHAASLLSADVALDRQHDVVFDPTTGDLVVHAPPEAYAQLAYNILSTELGSNPYWPEMGWPISRYVGAPLRDHLLPRIAQDCADALRRHPATAEVLRARASIVRDGSAPSVVMVEIDVQPVHLPPTKLTGVFS